MFKNKNLNSNSSPSSRSGVFLRILDKIGFGIYVTINHYAYSVIINVYKAKSVNNYTILLARQSYSFSYIKSYRRFRSYEFFTRTVKNRIKSLAREISNNYQ